MEFESITDRITLLRVNLQNKNKITIVQIYASTTNLKEGECVQFYCKQKINLQHKLFILGYFNSKVGQRNEKENR